MILNSVISPVPKRAPLLILEHDLTRSTIPIIRELIYREVGQKQSGDKRSSFVILATFLHPPNVFVRKNQAPTQGGTIREKDYTDGNNREDHILHKIDADALKRDLMEAIESAPASDPVLVILDSVDTLSDNVGSSSSTLRLLQDMASSIKARKVHGTMVLSITSRSALLPHILPPSFSQTLTHLRLYHPSIILHLHKAFLLPPPPISSNAKFYSIFTPFSQRERRETESLFFSPSQDLPGDGGHGETVIEISLRSVGLRKGVERELAGWKDGIGPCSLEQLEILGSCFVTHGPSIPTIHKPTSDPAQNLPFNLNLTTEQQESRAQVPLPYAHTGESNSTPPTEQASSSAAIYYDPDSADDFDDEDPDEDLDL